MKVTQDHPHELVGVGSGTNWEGPSHPQFMDPRSPQSFLPYLLPPPSSGPSLPTHITQILIITISMSCFLAEPNYGVVQA